ncbi:hypothetical protein EVAR_11532_1 [Eumeta japonica]|uniref:Uncharacterized protein n=1 Tax=Eumeta variegata TaxID=151549 RepID=A0A4C1TYZ2_EUMVA|nr:hypothetical protein EVAR_11532_1 [Eumeta japonica]
MRGYDASRRAYRFCRLTGRAARAEKREALGPAKKNRNRGKKEGSRSATPAHYVHRRQFRTAEFRALYCTYSVFRRMHEAAGLGRCTLLATPGLRWTREVGSSSMNLKTETSFLGDSFKCRTTFFFPEAITCGGGPAVKCVALEPEGTRSGQIKPPEPCLELRSVGPVVSDSHWTSVDDLRFDPLSLKKGNDDISGTFRGHSFCMSIKKRTLHSQYELFAGDRTKTFIRTQELAQPTIQVCPNARTQSYKLDIRK